MKRIIEVIQSRILDCKETGKMFTLPTLDIEGIVVNHLSIKGDGATLYHDVYDIVLADDSIHIDYRSKDQCKSYQAKPDRSVIVVTCSDPKCDFNDAWDEIS